MIISCSILVALSINPAWTLCTEPKLTFLALSMSGSFCLFMICEQVWGSSLCYVLSKFCITWSFFNKLPSLVKRCSLVYQTRFLLVVSALCSSSAPSSVEYLVACKSNALIAYLTARVAIKSVLQSSNIALVITFTIYCITWWKNKPTTIKV